MMSRASTIKNISACAHRKSSGAFAHYGHVFTVAFASVLIVAAFPSISRAGQEAGNGPSIVDRETSKERILADLPSELKLGADVLTSEEPNAWEPLTKMLRAAVEPDEETQETIFEMLDGDFALPSDKNRQALEAFVAANRASLDMLRAVVQFQHIRVPEGSDVYDSVVGPLFEFRIAALGDIHLRIDADDYTGALKQIEELLLLGDMLRKAGSGLPPYARGLSLQEDALEAALELARQPDVPETVLQSLVVLAEQTANSQDSLPAVIRFTFHEEVLPMLSSLPANNDPAVAVVEVLSSSDEVNANVNRLFADFDLRKALAKRGELIKTLLRGHRSPLDRDETIRLCTDIYCQAVRNAADMKWIPPANSFESEVSVWPDAISLRAIDTISLYLGNPQPEIDQHQMSKARVAMQKVDNPLGKHLLVDHNPQLLLFIGCSCVSDLRCRTATLGVRLYHARYGKLPESLEAVVEANILNNFPRDPFGDLIKYDRAAKTVWSVGVNGLDDRGRNTQRHEFTLESLRKLAPAGAKRSPAPESEKSDDPVADDRTFPIPFSADGMRRP